MKLRGASLQTSSRILMVTSPQQMGVGATRVYVSVDMVLLGVV